MVDASGCLSVPLYELRRLVAASATFQTLVDAEDAAAALARVYRTLVKETEIVRPCAQVWFAPGDWRLASKATTSAGDGTGAMMLGFEAVVPEAYMSDDESAETWFTNQIGAILQEMNALEGRGYLLAGAFSLEAGPVRASESSSVDIMYVVFRVPYGLGK